MNNDHYTMVKQGPEKLQEMFRGTGHSCEHKWQSIMPACTGYTGPKRRFCNLCCRIEAYRIPFNATEGCRWEYSGQYARTET